MKLSTRSKYGLLALHDLATNRDAPVTIKSIASRQELSEAYLEQLFASLKKAGLVISKRGAQGGYALAREPETITMAEILTALEGSVSITDCVSTKQCGSTCECPSRMVFTTIQKSIDEALESMTLLDMIQNKNSGLLTFEEDE